MDTRDRPAPRVRAPPVDPLEEPLNNNEDEEIQPEENLENE